MEIRRSSTRSAKLGLVLTALAGAAVVVAASWLHARMDAPAKASRPQPAAADADRPLAVSPSTTVAPSTALPGASATGGRPTSSLPPVETPAESLRKVQVALAGGTAQEALYGAAELESCAHADQMANALMQSRETIALLPPEAKKVFEKIPPPSAEMIARAQSDQRRCQVFDAATLARRGELYQKAYEGGAEGAALPYLNWLKSDDGPRDKAEAALIDRVQAAVRADANAADFGTLASFAFGGNYTAAHVGASPVEAQAYREAYFRIGDETSPSGPGSTRAQVDKILVFGPKPAPLTQQQQHEADALAGRVVDAWHRRARRGS